MRTHSDKLYWIVRTLIDSKDFIIGNENPLFRSDREMVKDIPPDEIESIFKQLEVIKSIKIIKTNVENNILKIEFEIIDLEKLNKIAPLRMEDIRKRYGLPEPKDPPLYNDFERNENKFYISFNDDRKIMLNGKIELARPDLNSKNDILFSFLFKNPNQKFEKKELEMKLNIKIDNGFHKFVENLNFRKGLKSAFFDINKTSIIFKNPIEL